MSCHEGVGRRCTGHNCFFFFVLSFFVGLLRKGAVDIAGTAVTSLPAPRCPLAHFSLVMEPRKGCKPTRTHSLRHVHYAFFFFLHFFFVSRFLFCLFFFFFSTVQKPSLQLVLAVQGLVHRVHVLDGHMRQEHLDLVVELLLNQVLLRHVLRLHPLDKLAQLLRHRQDVRLRQRRLRHHVLLRVQLLADRPGVLPEGALNALQKRLPVLVLKLELVAQLVHNDKPLLLQRVLVDLARPLRRQHLRVPVLNHHRRVVSLLEAVGALQAAVRQPRLELLHLHLLRLRVGGGDRLLEVIRGVRNRHHQGSHRKHHHRPTHFTSFCFLCTIPMKYRYCSFY
eukprot:Rhum_TRINITY_DN12347_c0_g1::Rhum_TRINITY_DN12347_c0_g1_i1::g.50836::m.50836